MSLWLLVAATAFGAEPEGKKPHVVFVTGGCEYRGEVSMPMIAKILQAKHDVRCTVLYAVNPKTGKRDANFRGNIKGLEKLNEADLAVIFLRFRNVPDDQLKKILDFTRSEKPVVGIRTALHAFLYSSGPNEKYNEGFGEDVFGQRGISHPGHNTSTNVRVVVGDHPIVRGVAPAFHTRSWLYKAGPLRGDCVLLVFGAAVEGPKAREEIFGLPSPVAWTRTDKGKRVFFTSLGHPEDFEHASVRRLLIQAIFWGLGMEEKVPVGGLNAQVQGKYVAPPVNNFRHGGIR